MKVIWPQNFLSLPHYFLLNKNVFNCHVNHQSYQKIVFRGFIDFFLSFTTLNGAVQKLLWLFIQSKFCFLIELS